jgi:hypothetical protein
MGPTSVGAQLSALLASQQRRLRITLSYAIVLCVQKCAVSPESLIDKLGENVLDLQLEKKDLSVPSSQ